jgi:Spy/CpxP family protein refolding chaperone
MLPGRTARVFVLAVVAIVACSAAAQNVPPPTPPPSVGSPVTGARPKRTLEGSSEMRRLAQLKLTDDQMMKLRPIVDDEGVQLSAVRLDEHLTPDQRRDRSKEIRDLFRPRITAILTPEQQAKWKQMDAPASPKTDEKAKPGDSDATPPKPQ